MGRGRCLGLVPLRPCGGVVQLPHLPLPPHLPLAVCPGRRLGRDGGGRALAALFCVARAKLKVTKDSNVDEEEEIHFTISGVAPLPPI